LRLGGAFYSTPLADQQNDAYQQRNQNTDNERGNPTPTLDGLRSSALLRRPDA
jgi:hypothetical protein